MPPVRWWITRWSRKQSTPSILVPGRWGRNSSQVPGSSSAAVITLKSLASSLVVTKNRPTWWARLYSTPFFRPRTRRGSSSGRSAGTSHSSLVVWLLQVMTRNFRLRVLVTDTKNDGSDSWYTTSSLASASPRWWRCTR